MQVSLQKRHGSAKYFHLPIILLPRMEKRTAHKPELLDLALYDGRLHPKPRRKAWDAEKPRHTTAHQPLGNGDLVALERRIAIRTARYGQRLLTNRPLQGGSPLMQSWAISLYLFKATGQFAVSYIESGVFDLARNKGICRQKRPLYRKAGIANRVPAFYIESIRKDGVSF
jgi:hypothetical protein